MNKSTIHIAGSTFEFDETTGTLQPADRSHATIDVRNLSRGEYSVIVNGMSHHVYVRTENGVRFATVNNRTVEIHVERQRDRLLQSLQKASDVFATKITHVAPMPGMITKILQTPGAFVESGTGIVIIEAMKMENEITAKKGGVISMIHVIEKQTVEKNDHLFTLETV